MAFPSDLDLPESEPHEIMFNKIDFLLHVTRRTPETVTKGTYFYLLSVAADVVLFDMTSSGTPFRYNFRYICFCSTGNTTENPPTQGNLAGFL